MTIELPKDADGREIPLDTEVLYDMCETKVSVKEFLFRTLVESQRTQWTIKAAYEGNFYYNSFKPENMHLTPPDSWEKLEEDMTRAINAPKPYNFDSMTCGYFDNAGSSCQECKKKNGFDSFNCNTVAWKDILSRIRKLRGEDE